LTSFVYCKECTKYKKLYIYVFCYVENAIGLRKALKGMYTLCGVSNARIQR